MKKLILICVLALISTGVWAKASKAGNVMLIGEYQRHDVRVTSMCIEGHVVVVSHSDVGQGGGLQMIQLQHVVDGKTVPMKCDAESQAVQHKQ